MARDAVDKVLGKAQDTVGKFMADPEKVAKAKGKAGGFLQKHMDAEQADKVVSKAEELLSLFGRHERE